MRRAELTANILLFPTLTLVGIILASLLRNFSQRPKGEFLLAFALWIVGFLFFLKAKWSRISAGNFTEFGCSKMTHINKRLYIGGYVAMALGFLTAILTVA